MRKYFWQREPNREMVEFAKSIKEANKNLADSIREASNEDVKARDRADITLEEYERLKEEIRWVKEENERLKADVNLLIGLLSTLRIPANILKRIKPETIKSSVCHNVKGFVDTFRIEFDVDVPYPYGEDYEY